jgi:pilus assembly protein TadC
MGNLTTLGLWLLAPIVLGIVLFFLYRVAVNRRSADRLFNQSDAVSDIAASDSLLMGMLRRWLFLAGYRHADAPAVFVGTMLLAVGLGLAAAFAVLSSGVMKELFKTMARFPPPTGDLVLPIAYLAPWTVLLILVLLPVMIVRRSRRQRTEKVEQDLPICLELLATLSEAGLGFDAALSRVLDSVMENRPLGREFRTYQSDLLAGRTRVESLRRVARRLQVSSVTILVSALVQAEQLGSGITQALRRQADDLRDRRRERANAFAMALPVKRMFPLVICFMPGIFIWTLGPSLTRLFQVADSFMRRR